tara:strand:+ start:7780 stop:8673 length:894 start_codon:yes stop_codon:yes gene_type:complete
MAKVLSMTGFARSETEFDGTRFVWELKSVNGKGLDIRFRMPGGFEAVELNCRKQADQQLGRGNLTANLTVQKDSVAAAYRINRELLRELFDTCAEMARETDSAPPRLDVLASVRGVLDMSEAPSDGPRWSEQELSTAGDLFGDAMKSLIGMRQVEGNALQQLLVSFVSDIRSLTNAAKARSEERPEIFLQRLRESIERLTKNDDRFDTDKLSQEALLLAAKADIREELDRLHAHCDAASQLLSDGNQVGRKLDFLCQELNREANTLCSKANDVELTGIGMNLKSVIEQFREQVQNVE